MTTIDGRTYTFNGLGEYWLIKTMNNMNGTNISLSVQSRTEVARNLINPNKTSQATIFSGFAMRAGNGITIEVKILLILFLNYLDKIGIGMNFLW